MGVVGLYHFTERIADGSGHPLLDIDNGEELMHIQPSVAIALNNHPPESPGTLYISTKRVIWFSDVDQNKGYAVGFLSIALHAVSRDPETYPSPCIYMQIETEGSEEEESEGSDSESNEHLELSKVTETRLVPTDPTQLDAIFSVFCECAELNPEPVEEQDEENEWIFSAEQMEDDGIEDSEWHFSENPANPIGYANGDHDLARTVLELHINDQRFEDADETEHGSRGGRQ